MCNFVIHLSDLRKSDVLASSTWFSVLHPILVGLLCASIVTLPETLHHNYKPRKLSSAKISPCVLGGRSYLQCPRKNSLLLDANLPTEGRHRPSTVLIQSNHHRWLAFVARSALPPRLAPSISCSIWGKPRGNITAARSLEKGIFPSRDLARTDLN